MIAHPSSNPAADATEQRLGSPARHGLFRHLRRVAEQPWTRSPGLWLGLALGGACAAAAVAVIVEAWRTSAYPLPAIMMRLPVLLELGVLAAGVVLVGVGWPYRAGRSLHCASCGYQRVAETHSLLLNCPECGTYWRMFNGWRVGRPMGNRRRVAIGLLLIALAGVGLSVRTVAADWIAGRSPTGLLIRHAIYAPAADTRTTWRALARRSLSAGEIEWIANALLDRRRVTGVLDSRSLAWLHDGIIRKTLSPTTITRYYDEIVGLRLIAPPSVAAGEPVEIIVEGAYRGPNEATPDGFPNFVFAGMWIDKPPPPPEDGTEHPPMVLESLKEFHGRWSRAEDPSSLRLRPHVHRETVRALDPGTMRVRATAWVMLGFRNHELLAWTPEDEPRPPLTAVAPAAMNRMVRLDLECEIEVTPR